MMTVILGMHKSGTTLVAKTLHRSGVSMVDAEPHGSYEDGAFYERQSCYELNLQILGWPDELVLPHRPPDNLTLNDDTADRMRLIIAENDALHDHWGFKDPRTSLTYVLWQEHLPDHQLIVMVRPVEDIWPRYHYRGLRFWKHPARAFGLVRAWCAYNTAILDSLKTTDRPVLVMSFRALMRGDDEFQRLVAFMGFPLADMRDTQRRPALSNAPVLEWAKRAVKLFTLYNYDQIMRQLDAARDHQLSEEART